MDFDSKTNALIEKRMKELSKDKEFSDKLDKEVAPLKGRNLKKYISEASKKSESEVR